MKQETVLIVDDVENNRILLQEMIESLGHKTKIAHDGPEAIEQIQTEPPDLVLLDVILPEMDGLEVLRRIKNNADWRDIPVIIITIIDDIQSAVQYIENGAEDYLNKPFNSTLLKARVNACLEKKRLRDREKIHQQEMESHNQQLEERVIEKTQALTHAHNQLKVIDQTKSDFLKLISHELRTPLNGLLGSSELLLEDKYRDDSDQRLITAYERSRERLLSIMDHALLLTEIEMGNNKRSSGRCSVQSLLTEAKTQCVRPALIDKVDIGQVPTTDAQIQIDEQLALKAIIALLEISIRFCAAGNEITLSCTQNSDTSTIEIKTIGTIIPEDILPKFFEIFSLSKPIFPGGDLGLGPPLAARIIDLYDGSISVENHEGPGIQFSITLPIK